MCCVTYLDDSNSSGLVLAGKYIFISVPPTEVQCEAQFCEITPHLLSILVLVLGLSVTKALNAVLLWHRPRTFPWVHRFFSASVQRLVRDGDWGSGIGDQVSRDLQPPSFRRTIYQLNDNRGKRLGQRRHRANFRCGVDKKGNESPFLQSISLMIRRRCALRCKGETVLLPMRF